jgi:aminoglycoside phosphotransferase
MTVIDSIVLDAVEAAFPDKNSQIRPLKAGYESQPYQITNEAGEFVALMQKRGGIGAADYAPAYAILKTLENRSYPFAPHPVYLNTDHSLIMMEFVSATSLKNLSSVRGRQDLAKNLLTALLSLHDIPLESCQNEFATISNQSLKPVTARDDVAQYLVDWTSLARAGQPSRTHLEWFMPKVARAEAYFKNIPASGNSILSHSDTTEGNILLLPGDRPVLIDWEGAVFRNYPEGWYDYGISYLMTHVALFQEYRSYILRRTCDTTGISMDSLLAAMKRQLEFIKLCDISWAIMMHSRVAAGEINGDPKKFSAIAHKRIQDYKEQFENRSFL